MQGVRTPSPITMEVPSIVANNRKNFAELLFSSLDLSFDAICSLLLGSSNRKLETSLSSACWLGINPTLAYRHIREYKANVPPENYPECLKEVYSRLNGLFSSFLSYNVNHIFRVEKAARIKKKDSLDWVHNCWSLINQIRGTPVGACMVIFKGKYHSLIHQSWPSMVFFTHLIYDQD